MNKFEDQLVSFAETMTPESRFAGQLEARLRQPGAESLKSVPLLPRAQKWLLNTAAGIVMLIALIAAVPPLRSFAQEIIDHLFVRLSSDQTVFVDKPAQSGSGSTPVASIFSSIADANAGSTFSIPTPGHIPSFYDLDQVYLWQGSGEYQIMYNTPGGEILITHRLPESGAPIIDEIGASAPVKPISLNWNGAPVQGEYVEGTWMMGTGDPEMSEWNNLASVHRLRWQVNDFLYEVAVMGLPPEQDFSAPALVAIAESMQ